MLSNGFGWPHLLIIALVFMLLFGAKRLPEAAQSLGKSLKVFKKEMTEVIPAPPEPPAQPGTSAPAETRDVPRGQTD